MSLAGPEGLLSANATAGTETSVPVLVANTGTAPAENVNLSANAPSGWKVSFEPKTIDRIAPNQHKQVQALITPPSAKADRWHGPYITEAKVPSDPWGETYQYAYPGTHNKGSYDVWSKGPDKQSGNEDDIGNWESVSAVADAPK